MKRLDSYDILRMCVALLGLGLIICSIVFQVQDGGSNWFLPFGLFAVALANFMTVCKDKWNWNKKAQDESDNTDKE